MSTPVTIDGALVAFDPLLLKGDPGEFGSQGPTGAVGATTNLTMGTVTTVPTGQAGSASLTGTPPNQVLNLILPTGPAGPAAGSDYLPEAYGATGDGAHDDTVAVQAALTAAPNGSRVYLSRTYKTTSQVNLAGKTGVEIYGPGKINYTDSATSSGGTVYGLQLLNCTDCKITGIELDVITQSQQYNGIQITSCVGVSVNRCKVRNARWVGIAVDGVAGQGSQSKNVTVDGNTVLYSRYGIVTAGEWTKINDNFIAAYWLSSTEAQSGAWQSSSNYYDGIIVGGGALETTVTNNTIVEPGQSGVYSTSSTVSVVGNSILRPQNWGIDFGPGSTATGITVAGNTIIDAAAGSINFFQVNESTIVGNTCINTGTLYFGSIINKAGIALNANSSYNTVTGNTVVLPTCNTKPALFANTTAPAAIGNKFVGNNPTTSPVPYTLDAVANTVIDSGLAATWGATTVATLYSDGLITADGTASTGFTGRNLLKLIPSSDNTFAQVTCDAASGVKVFTSGGAGAPLTAGPISGTNLSMGGTFFFSGASTGPVAMGSNKITGLANGTASSDAAAFGQVPAIDATATDIKAAGVQAAGAVGKAADAGHIHPGGATIITSTNASWPIPAGAALLEITAVGGGGQGGGGGSAAAAQLQGGGGGGSAGCSSTQVVSVGANTTLNVTIAAGGSAAGAGGALGGNAGGTGSNGAATTVTGTGISVSGGAGTGGGGSSASSTTGGQGAVYGSGGFRGTTVNAGSGAVGGGFSGQPTAYSPGGGGGGGSATATLGGGGGGAGVFSGQSSPGSNGASGTAAGVVGVAGAANTGAGGGGGGGGAAGTGAGGAGGAGGSGFVVIKVIG